MTASRKLRIAGILILSCATALLFLNFVQGSRGQSEWDKARAELAARGLDIQWENLIPPPVSDDLNFYAHPAIRELLPVKGVLPPSATNPASAHLRVPDMTVYGPRFGQPFVMTNLLSLPKTFAEEIGTNNVSLEELLLWSREGDAVLAAMREAAQRPHFRLDGAYSMPFNMPIPNFVAARALAQFLGSRARVHLLTRNSAAAFEDLEAVHVIIRAFNAEPRTLVSAMVRTAIGGLYVEVVKDGLKEGLWAEPELRLLANRLAEIDFIDAVHASLREGELAGISRFFDQLAGPKNSPERQSALQALGATQLTPNDVLVRGSPRSWIRRNQALHARLMMGFIASMDGEKRRYYAKANEEASVMVNNAFKKWSPHSMLAGMATLNFLKAGTTTVKNQMKIDQAAIVCALELFKLGKGAYPLALSDLSPAFIDKLPHDPFSGASYRYRREGDSFVLYSVSANEQDDGGIPAESLTSTAKGDWVWGKEI